ncbi:DUF3363 domain-containing protein [Niveispirillum sp.]|uniref:DUF3363 domain-containing protein n=1 Tax=Niveispirillum sp. TaxID=1917217 RepID=UPI0025DA055D|nr:DUF3363 domain-containing protein [Niveispirillum sp.]
MAALKAVGLAFALLAIAGLPGQRTMRLAGQLSDELGLPYASLSRGQPVDGIYRRTVVLAGDKLALVERSRDFTLVPWRAVLDRHIGQPVSGIISGDGVTWNFGRQRGGPQVG